MLVKYLDSLRFANMSHWGGSMRSSGLDFATTVTFFSSGSCLQCMGRASGIDT